MSSSCYCWSGGGGVSSGAGLRFASLNMKGAGRVQGVFKMAGVGASVDLIKKGLELALEHWVYL